MPFTEPIRDAIRHASAWICALESDGGLRDGAEVVEITHRVDPAVMALLPAGTR